ncbi:hypothetical protein AJ88_13570 [Mesorhizobium amorphae CCBAU 01583]|nr:hypothetical protein AJ88_13570 [Mesorhizobium amorphae CCBAU 01583]
MNQQPNILSPKEAFKACFSAVAAYLGRPSAETVLFAGVPIAETRIEAGDIRHLAERIGLEVAEFNHRISCAVASTFRPSSFAPASCRSPYSRKSKAATI